MSWVSLGQQAGSGNLREWRLASRYGDGLIELHGPVLLSIQEPELDGAPVLPYILLPIVPIAAPDRMLQCCPTPPEADDSLVVAATNDSTSCVSQRTRRMLGLMPIWWRSGLAPVLRAG